MNPNFSYVALQIAELWINLISIFCQQEGSGVTLKYPVILGRSIKLFGHFENLNLSIIDAKGSVVG